VNHTYPAYLMLNTRLPDEVLLFKLYRRHAAVVAVSSHRVVEHFDVVEDVIPGLFPGVVDPVRRRS